MRKHNQVNIPKLRYNIISDFWSVIFKFALAGVILNILFILLIIVSQLFGFLVALLFLPIFSYIVYYYWSPVLNFIHMLLHLEWLKKQSLVKNTIINISKIQIHNHYNYYPKSYIETRFKIFKIIQNLKIMLSLYFFVYIIIFLSITWEWNSMILGLKWSSIMTTSLALFHILKISKALVKENNIPHKHYMLRMNPKYYSILQDKIFFY